MLYALPALAVSDLGGRFALIDQHGVDVTEENYRGKPALLYFGFSSCGDVCPTDLVKMGFVVEQLVSTAGIEITPIFVTIDPERDTPERMAAYLTAFHPDFVGLTGSDEAIADIADKYAVYYAPLPMGNSYMMDHSTLLFLIDANGDYVAHFTRDVPVNELTQSIIKKLSAP